MAGRIRYLTQTELKKVIGNLMDGLTDEEELVVNIGVLQGLGFRFGQGRGQGHYPDIVTVIYMFTTLFLLNVYQVIRIFIFWI